MNTLVLDSLTIKGFRTFEHLDISRLAQVNLIVGKNNVGKSCLLEAIRIYAHRGNPEVILDILASRDEAENIHHKHPVEDETYIKAFRHLFYGRSIFSKSFKAEQFSIGPTENDQKHFSIRAEWYEQQDTPKNDRRRWKPARQLNSIEEILELAPGITIRLGNEKVLSLLLSGLFPRTAPWSFIQGIPCKFISTNGLKEEVIAELWDRIALKPEEEEVARGLSLIVPDIERLTLIGQNGPRSTRIPVVKLSTLAEPLPLRSLGEGTNRLFGILLALVNARDGLLLIDEVDSGLHYTVHSSLWRIIFDVAQRLNVQVFATTHSWDCIEGFQQNLLETPEEGLLIRLENRQGHIVPILFDGARLGIATRQDVEVR